MKARRLLAACAFALGLMLALMIGLNTMRGDVHASAAIRYVAHDCSSIPAPCYTTIQAASNAAVDGDTIRVIQGVYREAVVITESITLQGGWSKDTLQQNWDVYTTTIDARGLGSAIRARGKISPTIEGFIVTGGDGTGYLGWGGGILIHGEWDGPGLATIRHNVITNNAACITTTCQGYGGGVMVYSSQSVIEYNTIISNAARAGGAGSGHGGGIAIWGWPGDSTIAHNVIASNTAVFSATGAFADGQGGGVWRDGDLTLIDNEIRGNVAAVKGEGRGGGAFVGTDLYDNRILSNTASISGTGYGGGVYSYYVTDFHNNLVQGNVASKSGDGTGGGLFVQYLAHARYNTIAGNSATRGGGVYFDEYTGNQEFKNNLVARNSATGLVAGTWDGGGGIASRADWVEIVGNEILTNTALAGGGVLVTGGDRYQVQNNSIQGNGAVAGGGLYVYTATGAITRNWIVGNVALWWGGGMLLSGKASPLMDRNIVAYNTAGGHEGLAGGGLMLNVAAGVRVTVTNHAIAHNTALTATAGGVHCVSGSCALIHNTIVDNKLGAAPGEGVRIGAGGGTNVLRNNIIVGHGTGLYVAGGASMSADYNDYYDNAIRTVGIALGPHDRTDNPQFENRTAGDYHLALTSPVIDQGDNAVSAPVDWDGDLRPRGGRVDIGADEAYRAESYVSVVTGNDVTGTGSSSRPFASVTKGISETRSGGAVYVGRGRYTERITVTRSVNLMGGYRETDWLRDMGAYGVTLDGARAGTVVNIRGYDVRALIEGFVITGGEASVYGSGGGILVHRDAVATIRYNTITGNHARNGGGGLMVSGSSRSASVVDSNRIYNNAADGVFEFLPPSAMSPLAPQEGPEPGGGALVQGPARVINNWIYSNTSGCRGDGLGLMSGESGPVQAYHNTVADNGGSSGEGVWLGDREVFFYNNLIVGHGVGITATTSTGAGWDYNGFHGNVSNYAPSLAGGAHDVNGDPQFANRAVGDLHVGLASVALDAGMDTDVTRDIDGDLRPVGRPDLGADESGMRLYLPAIMRN